MILTIATIFIIIVCLGIVFIVLIQNPKGGGISSNFGALNQIGGVKQTTEGVEKVTWGLVGALVVLCLFITPQMRGGSTVKKGEVPESTIPMGNTITNADPIPSMAPGQAADTK